MVVQYACMQLAWYNAPSEQDLPCQPNASLYLILIEPTLAGVSATLLMVVIPEEQIFGYPLNMWVGCHGGVVAQLGIQRRTN